jgi:hypothetical protein
MYGTIGIVKMKECEMSGVCSRHGEVRNVCNIWFESLKGGDHSEEDLGIDGRRILKLMIENMVIGYGVDSSGSGLGPVVGT